MDTLAELSLTQKAIEDNILVQRALEHNDQKAYTELVDRCRGALYWTMFKMTENKQDAEDLTLEAFGKAFERLEQYKPNFAFTTWLYRIAFNNAIDFMRRKKIKPQPLSIDKPLNVDDYSDNRESFYQIESTDFSPEQELIEKESNILVSNLINELPEKYRSEIQMRFIKELKYKEIAKELDKPLGTIKALVFDGREKLREKLRPAA